MTKNERKILDDLEEQTWSFLQERNISVPDNPNYPNDADLESGFLTVMERKNSDQLLASLMQQVDWFLQEKDICLPDSKQEMQNDGIIVPEAIYGQDYDDLEYQLQTVLDQNRDWLDTRYVICEGNNQNPKITILTEPLSEFQAKDRMIQEWESDVRKSYAQLDDFRDDPGNLSLPISDMLEKLAWHPRMFTEGSNIEDDEIYVKTLDCDFWYQIVRLPQKAERKSKGERV